MAVRCVVTEHESGLVATLTGRLGLAEVGSLRLALFKCLAEQPDALFVDLAGLAVAQPLALTVFIAVNRQAARWPGIPVLLCAPSTPVGILLAEGPGRRLPVFPTVAAATGHAQARKSMPSLSDEILPISGAARHARNVTTEACLQWDLPDLIAPASLIANELVSNVVDHANTMATLRLSLHPRYLTIAVRDGSSATPVSSANAQGGRGLLLVQASAHKWGWMPTEGGKVVWASLKLSARRQ
jgi:anti-sigma regulatory factor (Ser/Thr protein kinase)